MVQAATRAGFGLAGVLVIVGIVLMIVWSFWLELIIMLVAAAVFSQRWSAKSHVGRLQRFDETEQGEVAMVKGFKEFVTGGNLLEVAVGLIMALALFALVQALIADLITPLIAATFGEPDFGDLSFTINGSEFRYGDFINALITFVSVAAAVYFFIVVPYQKYKRARGIGLGTKRCPECTMDMPQDARRCPHCTAQLGAAPAV